MPEAKVPLIILNVTGQPGVVIPAGFTKSGLPLYLRLVCQPFGEAMLYRVAQFYEDATGWMERHSRELSRILTAGGNICRPTEQMLFLKECNNA